MVLIILGLGTSIDYLSLEVLDHLSRADIVFLETYTSIAPGITYDRVKRMVLGELRYVSRRELEEEAGEIILEKAAQKYVVLAVAGDPMIATTHVNLVVAAAKKGIDYKIIPGLSGIQASISLSGLQVYRFGKIVTLTYPEQYYRPLSTIEVIRKNMKQGLHTLVLLDVRFDEGRAMGIKEASRILLELEEEYCSRNNCRSLLEETIGVGVARAGTREAVVQADLIKYLGDYEYPSPPHSLIVTGDLHPVELETLVFHGKLPLEHIRDNPRYERISRYMSWKESLRI